MLHTRIVSFGIELIGYYVLLDCFILYWLQPKAVPPRWPDVERCLRISYAAQGCEAKGFCGLVWNASFCGWLRDIQKVESWLFTFYFTLSSSSATCWQISVDFSWALIWIREFPEIRLTFALVHCHLVQESSPGYALRLSSFTLMAMAKNFVHQRDLDCTSRVAEANSHVEPSRTIPTIWRWMFVAHTCLPRITITKCASNWMQLMYTVYSISYYSWEFGEGLGWAWILHQMDSTGWTGPLMLSSRQRKEAGSITTARNTAFWSMSLYSV